MSNSNFLGITLVNGNIPSDPMTITFLILLGMANIMYCVTYSFFDIYSQGFVNDFTFNNLRELFELYIHFRVLNRIQLTL
jgi:hypothetical protein